MNLFLSYILSNTTGNNSESGSSGEGTASSAERLTETLRNMVKSPVFYIVIAAIVLLIIAIYLMRRIVKPTPNVVKIVVRGGKIHKLIKDNSPTYFLVPFRDSIGAIISLDEKELSSDQLFINNGPDALYKVNFTIKYKILFPELFFPYRENISKLLIAKINEELREYADEGHALEIVKDYRANIQKIIALINKSAKDFSVEVVDFKVNYIEPTVGK